MGRCCMIRIRESVIGSSNSGLLSQLHKLRWAGPLMATKRTNLFQSGTFKLASGKKSRFKIEMDALSDEDWETLALIAIEHVLPPFREVHGVPRGGLPFAKALSCHVDPKASSRIICDDV